MAATSSNNAVSLTSTVRQTLTAACPVAPVHLGSFIVAGSTTAVTVTCTVTHNRRTGNVRIVASPASNTMTLTSENGDTWPNNFSNFTTTSGTRTGTFATGITITNPARGSFNFGFRSRAQSPVPLSTPDGTYTGSHTLTFSLI